MNITKEYKQKHTQWAFCMYMKTNKKILTCTHINKLSGTVYLSNKSFSRHFSVIQRRHLKAGPDSLPLLKGEWPHTVFVDSKCTILNAANTNTTSVGPFGTI